MTSTRTSTSPPGKRRTPPRSEMRPLRVSQVVVDVVDDAPQGLAVWVTRIVLEVGARATDLG